MSAQVLRDYQQRGRAEIFSAWGRKARRVLAVLSVAGGKTTIFGSIAADLPCDVLILVHRRELAKQAANRLREFGVNFGLIMSGEVERPQPRIQIAMIQTLVKRKRFPRARVVIIDEAHLSTAQTYETILEHYPQALILGVTATPWRLGGKPLRGTYDELIVVAKPRELREQGHLSPYVGFSYKAPDLSDVGDVGDDYDQQQAAAAMSAITGDIVAEWLAHARHLSTVVFACTVEHSQKLTAEFRAAGVTAEHLDGTTPQLMRDAILARVDSGVTQVLCNVNVAVEGLDIPRLKCCVLARPTKSLARFIQQCGRVRRPWGGLVARIHDHAFNIGTPERPHHGMPDADRDYTLHAKREAPKPIRRCPACGAYYEPGATCDGCGAAHEVEARGERELKTIDDAEQFAFDSDAAELAAIPVVEIPKPPVQVDWSAVGRVVEGVYEGARDDDRGPYGPRTLYTVRGAKRTYVLPGTQHLNALMRPVSIGEGVRVKYIGDAALPGGRTRKLFEVFHGSPDEVAA